MKLHGACCPAVGKGVLQAVLLQASQECIVGEQMVHRVGNIFRLVAINEQAGFTISDCFNCTAGTTADDGATTGVGFEKNQPESFSIAIGKGAIRHHEKFAATIGREEIRFRQGAGQGD